MTEDEMVGWHHRPNGHGFGWTLGVGDGQGGLECYSSRGHKELNLTEQLNWNRIQILGASQVALVVKNLPAEDLTVGLVPGSGRSSGRRHGNPV